MAEDEELKPEVSQAASPAQPEEPAAPPPAPAPTPLGPPNKLYEWGAALGIMVFLALVLWVFLNFLRSAAL